MICVTSPRPDPPEHLCRELGLRSPSGQIPLPSGVRVLLRESNRTEVPHFTTEVLGWLADSHTIRMLSGTGQRTDQAAPCRGAELCIRLCSVRNTSILVLVRGWLAWSGGTRTGTVVSGRTAGSNGTHMWPETESSPTRKSQVPRGVHVWGWVCYEHVVY